MNAKQGPDNAGPLLGADGGGESAAVKGLRPLRGAKAPLTLQYPGVQVNIVHPDSEPPLLSEEQSRRRSMLSSLRQRRYDTKRALLYARRLGVRSLQSYSKQNAPPCGGAFCLELMVRSEVL